MSPEIEQIKNKIGVAEILGEYIKLIPAGTSYKALCPFHNEKTPSLVISPAKQIWRCFGCGEGGDIFSFLMKIEGLEFPEALKVLAKRAGVELSREYKKQEDDSRTRLYDLCDLAARYWHKILLDSSQAEHAKEYLKNRGLSLETIENFHIGYSVDSWDDLINFLLKKGFNNKEIFLSGLSVEKSGNRGFYNRFRDRIMFPIWDHHGRIVGFGGRALKKDEPAKYINTPQTAIYNKSEVLFGINKAKDAIRKEGLTILVEGYMDVIPSHQAGIKNVVSISGTALTEEQVRLLKRYSNNLSLALDMDAAGKLAALRSIDLALAAEMNVKVVTLPQGKDPGECVKNNPNDWQEAIKRARPAMEYFFERAVENRDVNQPQDKKEIAAFLLGRISKIASPIERDHWLKELAQKINVSEAALRESIPKEKQKIFFQADKAEKTPVVKRLESKDYLIFKRLLALLLAFPENLPKIAQELLLESIPDPTAQTLYKILVLYYTKNINLFTKPDFDNSEIDLHQAVLKGLGEESSAEEALGLLNEAYLLSQKDFGALDNKEARDEANNLFRILSANYLSARINKLKGDLEIAERDLNNEEIEKVLSELSHLISQKSHNS